MNRKLQRPSFIATGLAAASLAFLAACSSPPVRQERVAEAPIAAPQPAYAEYGQVNSIEVVPMASRPSGAGAILGAVVGAVVGNQFGAGGGRALATAGGAVGGAVAGNAIEGRHKRDDEVYRIGVRFDDGVIRTFDFHRIDDLRIGDHVKLEGGQIYRV